MQLVPLHNLNSLSFTICIRKRRDCNINPSIFKKKKNRRFFENIDKNPRQENVRKLFSEENETEGNDDKPKRIFQDTNFPEREIIFIFFYKNGQ